MSVPKCNECKNELIGLYLESEGHFAKLEDFMYCRKCGKPREVSAFFKRFGFEAFEKQNDKDRLELDGHVLIWKNVLGQEQYYCLTCDQELLHSHHHHFR